MVKKTVLAARDRDDRSHSGTVSGRLGMPLRKMRSSAMQREVPFDLTS
jgi:hypothetical protein